MNFFMQASTHNEIEACPNKNRLNALGLREQFIVFKSVMCRPKTSRREGTKREVEPSGYDPVIHLRNMV